MSIPLHSSIGFLISSINRQLKPLFDERLCSEGIGYGMWFFLRVLWEKDDVSQRELADRAGMSAPTALEAIRKLEQLKLISLKPNKQDKRRLRISLTAKGKNLEKRLVAQVDELNALALKGFSPEEVTHLRELLARVRANTAPHHTK